MKLNILKISVCSMIVAKEIVLLSSQSVSFSFTKESTSPIKEILLSEVSHHVVRPKYGDVVEGHAVYILRVSFLSCHINVKRRYLSTRLHGVTVINC